MHGHTGTSWAKFLKNRSVLSQLSQRARGQFKPCRRSHCGPKYHASGIGFDHRTLAETKSIKSFELFSDWCNLRRDREAIERFRVDEADVNEAELHVAGVTIVSESEVGGDDREDSRVGELLLEDVDVLQLRSDCRLSVAPKRNSDLSIEVCRQIGSIPSDFHLRRVSVMNVLRFKEDSVGGCRGRFNEISAAPFVRFRADSHLETNVTLNQQGRLDANSSIGVNKCSDNLDCIKAT